MTQYRLLDNTVDIIEATDEFWDTAVRKWKVVPHHFVGERFYAVIPYRRAIPDPENIEQESAVAPGEDWRLVKDDEIVLPTDERRFVNNPRGNWSLVTPGTTLRSFIEGESVTYAQIKERPVWRSVVFRRRATKKIVLKEYLERYGEHYRTEWHNGNVENCKGAGFIMPDESWPTGQEREIEITA